MSALLTAELLRSVDEELSRSHAKNADERARLVRLVGALVLLQGEQRSAAVPHALVLSRMKEAALDEHSGTAGNIVPLSVLLHGPRNEQESAAISVLLARALLTRAEDKDSFRALAPALDWLEFTGPYAPYTAAKAVLSAAQWQVLEEALRGAPMEAHTEAAISAVLALRNSGGAVSNAVPKSEPDTIAEPSPLKAPPKSAAPANKTVALAGELEGSVRNPLVRVLSALLGWSLLRGMVLVFARTLFSLRRPITLALDGEQLRLVGHTELLGRTASTIDLRFPLNSLSVLRKEERYPLLPISLSLTTLLVGAVLGAHAVTEGAGVVYFPLIALGFGVLLGGVVFELLGRALFPGLRGRTRLTLRTSDGASVELSELAPKELDRLLDAIDQHFQQSARKSS